MIRDNILPVTVATCVPDSVEEASDRIREYGTDTLMGITDMVFASIEQLRDALKMLKWRTSKPEVIVDIVRKQIALIRATREGIRYLIYVVENTQQCRVEAAVIDKVPRDLKAIKEEIEGTLGS